MNPKAIRALADSSAWKQTRDTLIAQRLADLKDVTKELDTDIDLSPGEAYLAKLAASKALEALIREIDSCASGSQKELTHFD